MAFRVFKKERSDTGVFYSDTGQEYTLAGYNLLYSLWNKRNKPTNCGWSVTADDLLKEHNEAFSSGAYALVIDFDPNSQTHIGLVEIEAVHLYTYGGGGSVYWSPLMLELRELLNDEEFDEPFTPSRKAEILARLDVPPSRKKIVEFLYLTGWNWGRTGAVNAAFIFDDARRYFQRVFNSD
jgi:hypothetical protein